MSSFYSPLFTGGMITACVVLTGLWLHAHTVEHYLIEDAEKAHSAQEKLLRQNAADQIDLGRLDRAIRTAQKESAASPEINEAQRRAASLVVIGQLKAEHKKNPPAPRQKPPPSGKSGIFFPELVSDPEYNRLYTRQTREMTRAQYEDKLQSLGLPPTAIEKSLEILSDRQMALDDYHQLSEGYGIPGDFFKKLGMDTNAQLKAVIGDEVYLRWTELTERGEVIVSTTGNSVVRHIIVPPRETLVSDANRSLIPMLATRLSYSEAPLQSDQAKQLAKSMANYQLASANYNGDAMNSDAFIAQASQVLSPRQVQALKEFQAERQASARRYKLSQSSTLPRNVEH